MNKRGHLHITRATAMRYLRDAGLTDWQAEDALGTIKEKIVNRPAPNTVAYLADDVALALRHPMFSEVKRTYPNMQNYATPSQRSRHGFGNR